MGWHIISPTANRQSNLQKFERAEARLTQAGAVIGRVRRELEHSNAVVQGPFAALSLETLQDSLPGALVELAYAVLRVAELRQAYSVPRIHREEQRSGFAMAGEALGLSLEVQQTAESLRDTFQRAYGRSL